MQGLLAYTVRLCVCVFKAPRTQPRSSGRWSLRAGHGSGSGGCLSYIYISVIHHMQASTVSQSVCLWVQCVRIGDCAKATHLIQFNLLHSTTITRRETLSNVLTAMLRRFDSIVMSRCVCGSGRVEGSHVVPPNVGGARAGPAGQCGLPTRR